ncbi:MAG: phosphate signaling complex protein PhoU [Candidatus Hydrothermales bacterium]
MFEEKLEELKREIISYAFLVERMIEKSIEGLFEKKEELLREVIEKDEIEANEFEIKIDELAITTIAKYEPKGKDLREVLMILKINNDLERMADHAVNICESALFLIERPKIKLLSEISKIASETIKMLKDSIDSFIEEDPKKAKSVCERDYIVDDLNSSISKELLSYMMCDPGAIERCMHIMRISNNIERIADLSTNISEDVIFMVEGKVIKHHKGE